MSEPEIVSRQELEELHQKVNFFTTSDGRRIAYYEYGEPTGRPIIYCHGTGSHIHVMMAHKAAKRRNWRIIVPDRPGVGQSDFQRERTNISTARDIAALADSLGIERFGIMGISGGGPALLACAHEYPHRLEFAVDYACAAPLYTDARALADLGFMDRVYARLGTSLPLAVFQLPFSLLGFMQKVLKNPRLFAKLMQSSMSAQDIKLFDCPEMAYLIMRDFQELFRNSIAGPALDAQLIYKQWGFSLSDINFPVHIFQGSEDRFVPPIYSQYLNKQLKNSTLHIIEGQGHFYHLACAEESFSRLERLIK